MKKEKSFEKRFEEVNIALQYREYEEAAKLYDELLRENSNLPELHNNYGLALFYLDKFDEALDEFNKAIKIDSRFALAYSNVGLVYLNKGEHEKAEVFFLKALEIDPENPETHYNLAVTCYRMDKKPDALKHYESFIKYSGEDYPKLKESVQKIIAQIKDFLQSKQDSQL